MKQTIWSAALEREEENPNECLIARNDNRDYPLEPGQMLTVSVILKDDAKIFENLGWNIVFTRSPTRLKGGIVQEK